MKTNENETKMIKVDGYFVIIDANGEIVVEGNFPTTIDINELDYMNVEAMTLIAQNEGKSYIDTLIDEDNRDECVIDLEFNSIDNPKEWNFTYTYYSNDIA